MATIGSILVDGRDVDMPALRQFLASLQGSITLSSLGITTLPTTAERDTFYATPENRGKLVYVNNNNGSATDPANGVYEYVSGAPRIAQGFYEGLAQALGPELAKLDEVATIIQSGLPPEMGALARIIAGSNLLMSVLNDGSVEMPAARIAGAFLRSLPAEVVRGFQLEIGENVIAQVDTDRGFYPFKLTLPATARFAGDSLTVLERIGSGQGAVINAPIAAFGDSLTQGYDGTGTDKPYTAPLADRLMVTVSNFGIMGQRSIDIAARQNGAPALLTVSGNTATTAGSTVTARSVNPLYYGGPTSMTGTVNGNRCRLSTNGAADSYGVRDGQLTLTAIDGNFSVPPNSAFITDQGLSARDMTQINEYGRNDIDWSGYKVPALDPAGTNYIADPIATTLASHAAAQAYLGPAGRMIHGGVLLSLDEWDGGPRNPYPGRVINEELRVRYGPRFVDVSSPATREEMARVGYSPTSDDMIDAGRGLFQRGLRSDSIHFNQNGYRIKALRYATALYAQGWYR